MAMVQYDVAGHTTHGAAARAVIDMDIRSIIVDRAAGERESQFCGHNKG